MQFHRSKIVRAALAAAALSVGAAGASHAAIYAGAWDPAFGAPFPDNFGWRATADLFVPDTCVTAVKGVAEGSFTLGSRGGELFFNRFEDLDTCDQIEVRNATLFFYDTETNQDFDSLSIGTYVTATEDELYGSAYDLLDQLLYLVSFDEDGVVTDFQTSGSFAQRPTVPESEEAPCFATTADLCYFDYFYSLRLSNTIGTYVPPASPLTFGGFTTASGSSTGSLDDNATLLTSSDSDNFFAAAVPSGNPPTITFAPASVPEPGALALVGAALAALALTRRRPR